MNKQFAFGMMLLTVVIVSSGHAQIQAIGAGGGIATPAGNFSNFAGSGFGGVVRTHYMKEGLEPLIFTGAVGYLQFGAKEWTFLGQSTGLDYNWSLVPVMSGARYYLGQPNAGVRLYAGGEIGLHFYSVTLSTDAGQSTSGALGSSTKFALQPMAGAAIGPLDIYAMYSLTDLNYFGLNAMFVFPVGKKK